MSKWAPDSREADSWFSDEQLEKLTPADAVDDGLRSPVPTQMVSNGEYLPNPQTDKQKRVEARIQELAGQAAKKLGVTPSDIEKFVNETGRPTGPPWTEEHRRAYAAGIAVLAGHSATKLFAC